MCLSEKTRDADLPDVISLRDSQRLLEQHTLHKARGKSIQEIEREDMTKEGWQAIVDALTL